MEVLRSLPNSALLASTPSKVKFCSTSMLTPRTFIARPEGNNTNTVGTSTEKKRKISHCDEATTSQPGNSSPPSQEGSSELPAHKYKCNLVSNNEFMSVRKDEFMDIKNRVSLLECKLQNELDFMTINDRICNADDTLNNGALFSSLGKEMSIDEIFNLTLHESQKMNDPPQNEEFEIRKSQRPIRSPSARKIGSFRNKRRIRHSSSLNLCDRPVRPSYHDEVYSSKRLRRGRPNTVFTGLPLPSLSYHSSDTNLALKTTNLAMNNKNVSQSHEAFPEKWRSPLALNDHASIESRRSSINFIRQRNAGMVLQKAKLFGDVKSNVDPVDVHKSSCVFTPSPKVFTSRIPSREKPLVVLNNISNMRTPRMYRSKPSSTPNT